MLLPHLRQLRERLVSLPDILEEMRLFLEEIVTRILLFEFEMHMQFHVTL